VRRLLAVPAVVVEASPENVVAAVEADEAGASWSRRRATAGACVSCACAAAEEAARIAIHSTAASAAAGRAAVVIWDDEVPEGRSRWNGPGGGKQDGVGDSECAPTAWPRRYVGLWTRGGVFVQFGVQVFDCFQFTPTRRQIARE